MKLIILVVAVIVIAGHFVPISSKVTGEFQCVSNSQVQATKTYRAITGGLSNFKHLPTNVNVANTLACANGLHAAKSDAKAYLW